MMQSSYRQFHGRATQFTTEDNSRIGEYADEDWLTTDGPQFNRDGWAQVGNLLDRQAQTLGVGFAGLGGQGLGLPFGAALSNILSSSGVSFISQIVHILLYIYLIKRGTVTPQELIKLHLPISRVYCQLDSYLPLVLPQLLP